ncbi:MAG: AAC(3) family N-acetyltransferase [Bacteroidetes bacterium]|nr:MAG: AAC(3) family N-acetyltransferase [Bacteroidota bacterium]
MAEHITKDRLIRDLKELGVKEGDSLNLKISMKSIGYVEGGPNTVIEALREVVGESGTLVAESFVSSHHLSTLRKKTILSEPDSPSYAGAIANAMIKYPGVYRSSHPIQRFTVLGARAKELSENHTPDSYAYDILRVLAETGGKNLKIGADGKVIGVGTTHVAIGLLGLKQKIPREGIHYKDKDGNIRLFKRTWAGGCEKGFSNFVPLYENANAFIKVGKVGEAETTLSDMRKTLDLELDIMKKDPGFFLCDNPKCIDCRYSWPFSKGKGKRIMLPLLRSYIRLKRKLKKH